MCLEALIRRSHSIVICLEEVSPLEVGIDEGGPERRNKVERSEES